MAFGRPGNRDSACSRMQIYVYNREYFKSATTFLSYNSENIAWVERRQQVMNFKVRAKQKYTIICQINAVDGVALSFERREEVIPSGIALCLY